MKFDVIVGNPPYQLNDGGGMGTSATAIYNCFVDQAKKLNPRYLTMIIPSRWFSGGKGLDDFRNSMLNDNKIRILVDYFDSTDCFPGVDISGGICYFLWSRDNPGKCNVISHRGSISTKLERNLLEKGTDTFIRFNEAISIVEKIITKDEDLFIDLVSPRKPFGFGSKVDIKDNVFTNSVKMYSWPQNGYISRTEVLQNEHNIDKIKVFIAKAYGERGSFPYQVLSKPFIGEKNSCCSETYLLLGPFESVIMSKNVISYIKSRFFRFLVLLKKNTQNAPRGVYSLVPLQDFSESWTDEKLYTKYGLNDEEIAFIESMIKPMETEE